MDWGVNNHCTWLKLQLKLAKISDVCMQGTLLDIASKRRSQVTLGGVGGVEEAGVSESGDSGRRGDSAVREALLSTAGRVCPPHFCWPASGIQIPSPTLSVLSGSYLES